MTSNVVSKIIPLWIVLRGGRRVVSRVIAVIRVVCFLIIFYVSRKGQARVAYYVSAFNVITRIKRRN
jgi:hypothetical protein